MQGGAMSDENPASAPEDMGSSDGASLRGGDSAPSGESADGSSDSGPDSDVGSVAKGPASPGAEEADASRLEAPKSMPVAEDDDVEAFSDISDNSDIFHVEVLPDGERPCTPEDQDLARIEGVRQHLRKFPLLPADPRNPQESYTNVGSGARLPSVHCAFAGCTWSSEQGMHEHWEMERSLHAHLWAVHRDHTVLARAMTPK